MEHRRDDLEEAEARAAAGARPLLRRLLLPSACAGRAAAPAALARRVRALDARLAALPPDPSALPAVCTYATFDTASARRAALRLFFSPGGALGRLLFQRRALLFRGRHRLRLRPAPEPSNVLWANLQYGSANRFVRGTVTSAPRVSLAYLATLHRCSSLLFWHSLTH